MSALSDCYAVIVTAFGVSGPYYTPGVGHRGTDYRRGARQPVYAYESGEVGYVGSTGSLGRVVGMALDGGKYAGWAHLYGIEVWVGKRVRAGDVIGYAAGWGDYHGTAWSGPHIHTTLHYASSFAAATGVYPGLYDPAPRIRSAIAAYGGSSTAGGDPIPIEEEELMIPYPMRNDERAMPIHMQPDSVIRLSHSDGNWMNVSELDHKGYMHAKAHIVAAGYAGDQIDVWFSLYTPSTDKDSAHFVETIELNSDGWAKANVAFEFKKFAGQRVYLHVRAHNDNKAGVNIHRLSATASLYDY